jgi:hypothetical protein
LGALRRAEQKPKSAQLTYVLLWKARVLLNQVLLQCMLLYL